MKKTLLSLLSLSLSFPCFSQIGFSEQEITSFTKNTEDILEIDFDNDGDLDVVAIGLEVLDLYENVGGLYNFNRKRTLVTYGNASTSQNLYDFDMDNDLDIVYADNSSQNIVWHENDGSGNFGDAQIIVANLGATVRSLSFADMDGDTDDDIVYTVWLTQSTQRALWLENNGSATNYIVANTMFDSNIATPILLDFDTDGDLDAIIGASNSANWFHNDGNGNFGTETTYPLTNIVFQFDVVDIDGDNDYDFVYHKLFTGFERIMYYENEGNNTFMTEHLIAEGNFSNKTLAVEDVDNDNRLDVIYVEDALSISSSLVWKKNLDNNGNFGSPNLIYDNISNMDKIITVDIDNDGDQDVISTWDDLIFFNENTDALGTFAQEKAIAYNSKPPRNIAHGDIDNDGDIDIVVTESATFGIVLYKTENANGVDYYSPKQLINRSLSGVSNVFLHDMDGDTDLDLIVSSAGLGSATSHRLSWLENVDGQGNFSQPISITDTTSFTINEIALFDVDGDSDKDLVSVIVYSSFNQQLVWFENMDGQGTFSNLQVIDTGVGFLNYITGEDLNSDGTIDIIIADDSNDIIAWFPNSGSGNFGAQQTIMQNIANVNELAIADFDGDTFVDIAFMENTFPISIEWIQNTDGAGNFGPVQSIVPNLGFNQTQVIAAADIDNDGDQDIVTSAIPSLPDPSQVIWIENLDGQANFSLPITIGDNLQNISNLLVADVSNNGYLDVVIIDRNANTMFCYKNTGNVLNRIAGTVRADADANGCDMSDYLLSNFLITITDGTNSFGTFTLDENSLEGYYQYLVDVGNYTVSMDTQIPPYFTVNPVSQVSNFTNGGNEDIIDFCVESAGGSVNDLNVAVYPSIDDPRPGFNTTYQIVYRNIGTDQTNGDVTFQFDATKLQFLNATETVAVQTANTVTFNFSNLNPFETRTIDLQFNVFPPPTTNIDDILISTATINPVSGDATTDDNTFTLNQTVIGSYDPNDIRVLQGDEIFIDDIDKYLNYIIRFQNTGTASAINVRVDHLLDSKLDWTTIQLENLSHQGRVEITNGSDVSFIFDNINLPDSTNDEPNSHGYIAFKIKPKNNVVVGNIINGVADIYFDFNPPIITNTAMTEIVAPLSVTEFAENRISIYPNPTKDIITIKANQNIEMVTVYDINGRLLKTSEPTQRNSELEFQLEEFSNGIYFLKIQTELGTQTQKIIKE